MEGGKKKSAAYGSQCLYSAWLLLSYMVAAAVVEESEREREEEGREGRWETVCEESLRNVRGTHGKGLLSLKPS